MDTLLEFLLVIAPYLIVSATAIYLFHEYISAKGKMKVQEKPYPVQTPVHAQKTETSGLIQLKLQAAERFVLYLERIAPGRMVMRLHKTGMTSKMLQAEMVRVVREEFDHNLSQQIYMSDTCWELIKNAKEEMIKMINIASDALGENASGIDLGKKIFELAAKMKKLPHEIAVSYLRQDVHRLLD